MEAPILISRLFALCYLALGVGMLLNQRYYQRCVEKMLRDAGFLLYGGMFSLVIGALIVFHHNDWSYHWTLLITVIGWLAFFKGLALLVAPKAVVTFTERVYGADISKHKTYFVLLLGLVFTYFGFFH